MRNNIVLDTNTILSAALFPNSIVSKAAKKALTNYILASSDKTWDELADVFNRSKFDKYLPTHRRLEFLDFIRTKAIFFKPSETITDCRDPKDDKYLELAVEADALFIVTGDKDLLVLNPYRGIIILKSGDFLALELP